MIHLLYLVSLTDALSKVIPKRGWGPTCNEHWFDFYGKTDSYTLEHSGQPGHALSRAPTTMWFIEKGLILQKGA